MRNFNHFIASIGLFVLLFGACTKSGEGEASREVVKVTIDQTSLTLTRGETTRLHATVEPSNAIDTDIRWESTDVDVATVDEFGLVTAVKAGETTVLAYCGKKAGTCTVTVEGVEATSLKLDRTHVTASPDDVFTLTATYEPENIDDPTLLWTSSNKEVAEVDRNGQVTVLSLGTATITVALGELTATCEVVSQSKPNLFDLYYEDNTYSSEFNPDKQAIGVVFWVGDPTENDPELKKDHPECTHGLVISWSEVPDPDYSWRALDCYWQNSPANVGAWIEANTSYPSIRCSSLGGEVNNDLLNMPYGYSNTKAIREYNKANPSNEVTAVTRIDEFEKLWPAPKSSSGWYLPSAKEGSLMWGGEYTGNVFGNGAGDEIIKGINKSIYKARDYFYYEDEYDYDTGMYLEDMHQYWVSNEYYDNSDFAYYVSGAVMFTKKSDRQTIAYTRYIFAF